MALVLVACSRSGAPPVSAVEVARLAQRLAGAQLGLPPQCEALHGVVAVLSPSRYVPCLQGRFGIGIGSREDLLGWSAARGATPPWFSVVCRYDRTAVEIASDCVGSRTLWYALTQDQFVAATSQRAIVAILRSYEANPELQPWLFANGLLGPRVAWDRRIHTLPPDSTLRLDRTRWTLALEERSAAWRFSPRRSISIDIQEFEQALDTTFARFPFHDDQIVPLSGGHDSRCVLVYLRRHAPASTRLRAVTWGTRAALENPASDASIARAVCKQLGIEHRYLEIDPTGIAFVDMFRRFVAVGEGRIDHLSGYTDAFRTWERFANENIAAVVRGDISFGYGFASSERDVRLQMALARVEDFANLASIAGLRSLQQKWPAYLERRSDTLSDWNARLGHAYRIPTMLAALNQLKAPFTELVNPLLERAIVEKTRTLSRAFLIGKRGFKELVQARGPALPVARESAVPSVDEIIAGEEPRRFFLGALEDARASTVLPTDLVESLLHALQEETRTKRWAQQPLTTALASRVRQSLPLFTIAKGIRARVPLRISPLRLALRAAMIQEMTTLLEADSNVLDSR